MRNSGGEMYREKCTETKEKEKDIESNQRTLFIIRTKCTFLIRTNIVLIKNVHLVGIINGVN
jgi:hypothetical protein